MGGDFAKLQEKLQAKYGDGFWKKLEDNAIDMKELEEVAGGSIDDRCIQMYWKIAIYYGKPENNSDDGGKRAHLVDLSSHNMDIIVGNFCKVFDIQWRPHEDREDEFLIDGKWRNSTWMEENWNTAMKYLEYKLALKGGI